MAEFSFRLDLVQLLFEHRSAQATVLFQLFTFIGEIEGYVLVVGLIYAAYDKKLAIRLSLLVLFTMCLSHVLKTLIANPRPFVQEGTYAEKWAVSGAKAEELVAEYSTPSGHGMAGSCFYSFLAASVKRRSVRVGAIATLVLMGLSRPYLGVHYLEDVFLGWALGIPMALLALKFGENIANAWNTLSLRHQVAIVVGSSIILWLTTRPLYDANAYGAPLPFVSYAGLLTGIVLAYPLEARWVGFDPRSSTAPRKILRYLIGVALVMGTLLLLDDLFGRVASDSSLLGNVLRYVRYATAAVMGLLVGPFLFVRLGLAETTQPSG
jgi:membrane-associated phospholipid phosphatase